MTLTTPSVTIRRATLDDRERAWAIVSAYCDEIGVIERDTPEAFDHYFDTDAGIFLAELDDEARTVVGCVILRPIHVEGVGRVCEVKRLYVLSAARGQRVAERLVSDLEAYAVSVGYKWIYLDTHDGLVTAIKFYRRLGYDDVERYNENVQANVFMRKALSTN